MRRLFAALCVCLALPATGFADPFFFPHFDMHDYRARFHYDGMDLYDVGGKEGGNGNPAEASPSTLMDLLAEDFTFLELTTDGWTDLFITLGPLPVNFVNHTSPGNGDEFGVHVHMGGGHDWDVAIDLDKVDIFRGNGQGGPTVGHTLIIDGIATGIRSLVLPDYPFGDRPIDFTKPIVMRLDGFMENIQHDGEFFTSFDFRAVDLRMRVDVVPEPSGGVLAGLVGLVGLGWRRRTHG